MRDYTYDGVPVSRMPAAEIVGCLRDGVQINDAAGLPDAEAVRRVTFRLEIELIARKLRGLTT